MVVDTPPLAAEERLQIYAGMYLWRIVDALRENFPRVAAIVGHDAWAALMRAYLTGHPSEHPSIRHVGRALPAFIAAEPPPGAPPYLADLARLEWTRLDVFDAADAPALTLADLRRTAPEDWPTLRFAPVPAFARLTLTFPVQRVWAAAEQGDAAPLEPSRTALRVWRRDFLVYHAPMDDHEERALACMLAGEPFAAVCEVFSDLDAESAARAAGTLLASWIEDGILGRASPDR